MNKYDQDDLAVFTSLLIIMSLIFIPLAAMFVGGLS